MSIFGWSLPAGCGELPGEGSEAYEERIGGKWYAWDENDNVFVYDPKAPQDRGDGYVYIGKIVWPEDAPAEFDSVCLLREFVASITKEGQHAV
jgi:hypothetical protein